MNEDLKIALVKYITGQADETESAEIRQWIRSSSENEELYVQLYEAWQQSLHAGVKIDTDQAFTSFKKQLFVNKPVVRRLHFWSKVAAAVVIPIIIYRSYQMYSSNHPSEALTTVKVEKGSPRKIKLPDGTDVWVNAGSEIKYSSEFGTKNRTVYLDGEAYFDIAKSNKGIPFLVKTDRYTIRDVGTVFNVKAYTDGSSFETTVVEGKVSVEGPITENSGENSKVYLEANQVLNISNSPVQNKAKTRNLDGFKAEPVKVTQIDPVEIDEFNGWKDDRLVFQEDSFEEIGKILERRFGVAIKFSNDRLKNYKYTGTFRNLSSAEKVLHIIKETTPVSYIVKDNSIIVTEN